MIEAMTFGMTHTGDGEPDDTAVDSTDVVRIAAGSPHGAALLSDGIVLAWDGDIDAFELGYQVNDNDWLPHVIEQADSDAPLMDVEGIWAGGRRSFAILSEGTMLNGETISLPTVVGGIMTAIRALIIGTPSKSPMAVGAGGLTVGKKAGIPCW
ncbi:MAG: hypothetical protein CSA23_01875 [Deltaproteobacteria bacterium]|nr:MAG: hypothetical protein CSA23_01875 [Deltaproteobacteria bacterium]